MALALSFVLAVAIGVVVHGTVWFAADVHLVNVTRDSLQVATGALFFGAGLLHLSSGGSTATRPAAASASPSSSAGSSPPGSPGSAT